jgi:hypothetical protein
MATSLIPTVGQMVIGFILPFALAFVAIPLEAFLSACRTVLGIVAAGILRFLAFFFRLIGNTGYYIGRLVVNLYDLIIFPSIWLEGVIAGPKAGGNQTFQEPLYKEPSVTENAIEHFKDKKDYKEQQE